MTVRAPPLRRWGPRCSGVTGVMDSPPAEALSSSDISSEVRSGPSGAPITAEGNGGNGRPEHRTGEAEEEVEHTREEEEEEEEEA